MSFEMIAGELSERIRHQDEVLFSLADDPDRFPTICHIWERFYDDPVLSNEAAGRITHELIDVWSLQQTQDKTRDWMMKRLLMFFGRAYISGKEIRCNSD
jgi:hypothetical protein